VVIGGTLVGCDTTIDTNGVMLGHLDRPTGNVDDHRRYRLTE